MAKILRAQATVRTALGNRADVYRQFADGHTEPADEDDVEQAVKVRSPVVTRYVVARLGIMRDGVFVPLGKEDVDHLGTVEGFAPTRA